MSDFKKAFAKARKKKGADGTFKYKGKKYNTARADDPSMHGQEMKRTKGKLHTIEGHSWSTGDKKRKVSDPHGHATKEYPSDDKKYHYVKKKDGSLKITGSSPNKASTGYTPYTPFKMKAADHDNSPMKKNFGVGEKESPKELDSPNKFFGGALGFLKKGFKAKMRAKNEERLAKAQEMAQAKGQAAKQAAMANEAGAGGMDAPPAAEVDMNGQPVGGPEAGGGGEVPPHGPEAHTGGAGPQGAGPRPKGPFGGLHPAFNVGGFKKVGSASPTARPRDRGLLGNLFSDIRLKENITKTGVSKSGIPTYEFNYIGHAERYSGAMAQDLLAIQPDAVSLDASGYYKVNYNDIDVDMHLINN